MNVNKLFNDFILNLLKLKFKHVDNPSGSRSLTVYAHNLSGFDGYFLIEHLVYYAFGKVK
jgi:hypothetical protein